MINLIMPDGNQFPFSKQGNGTFVNSGIPSLGGGVMTVVGTMWTSLEGWHDFPFVDRSVSFTVSDSSRFRHGPQWQQVSDHTQRVPDLAIYGSDREESRVQLQCRRLHHADHGS